MITPEEQVIITEWTEIKQFKDPVYGYIPVNRPYVKYLIDTQMMQRIKGVAQTGLRPVFSSATHDRFSHSLGVFKFGMEMYDSFEKKLKIDATSLFEKWGVDKSIQFELEKKLRHWKTLLAIGCLLHDIGHPVQSHGFEFLYDDPYLDVKYRPEEEPLVIGDDHFDDEQQRVFSLLKEIKQKKEKTPEGNLRNALLTAFHEVKDFAADSAPGSPHERMSAYYILKDKKLSESIKLLIRASRMKAELSHDDSEEIDQDICYIARMIIGLEYPAEMQLSFDKDAFFNSVKNCVIHILNGKIDADGIDYLMRNSYAAGYDTSKIDSTRLCNAYTSYEKNYVIFPAFSKSALSVLEGYIAARNFEPKWLYSHHKVVYADLLTKRLYKFITRYLTDQAMLLRSVKLFLKHAEKSALVFDGKQDFGSDLMLIPEEGQVRLSTKGLLSHMEHWSYPFYTYLLAPCRKYAICSRNFSKTADADLDSLIHGMSDELAHYKNVTDPQSRYEEYTHQLTARVVNGFDECTLDNNARALRVLLAETCLEMTVTYEESLAVILKAWAETGDSAAAQEELEKWDGNPFDKDSIQFVKDILIQVSSGSGKELLKCWLDQYEPLLMMDDFSEFMGLLEEYETRSYRRSLWKSYPEYRLFIKDCSEQLGYSFDDVDRYMIKLIEEGMKEHGFSIFDGKAVKNPPELYREQFFYQQDKRKDWQTLAAIHRVGSTPKPKDIGKQIVQMKAGIIFSKDTYDFSRTKLVVTLYRIKPKNFNEIPLLFGSRAVMLEDILPTDGSKGGVFPYFYYVEDNMSGTPASVLKAFQTDFINYCRDYRASEVGSESEKVGKNHIFRDAVYGDIEMPLNFYAVVCTHEFQRLGRIRQLATADRAFPNATHTRLAHSIGTWHVMRMILQHFKQHYCANPQLEFSNEDENAALLAALLHDLGHGPYSHVIEEVFGRKHFHEKMTCEIILDRNTEISAVIDEQFGTQFAERVCRLLDGDYSPGENGIHLIYHTLISGQLDADRIDYLLRDNAACGMSFGHIDIQQLIASMRLLPVYKESGSVKDYRLCFDDHYLAAIDQFVYARYQMYRNVYYAPQKMLFEQIIKRVFLQASLLYSEIKKDPIFLTLMGIKNGDSMNVAEYILLDDESMNSLIKKWASGDILIDEDTASKTAVARKNYLRLLSQAFLDRHMLYERVDLGGERKRYDLLAKRIAKQLGSQYNTFHGSNPDTQIPFDEDYSAFIFIQGEMCAYERYSEEKKNITLRDLDDGTIEDYINRSMFFPVIGEVKKTLMKTDYCYLFFSKELLEIDCAIHEQPGKQDKICQMVESAKPRKHIEIEKKFYCLKEQFEIAKQYLSETYPDACKAEIEQTDTYYDCIVDGVKILYEKMFGFRRRDKDKQYIFTLKTPTDSPNYDSGSEFARHEYELVSAEAEVTDDVFQFLSDTISICGKDDILKQLDKNKMQVQLIVCNHRITYRLENMCEICLDAVCYKTPDGKPVDREIYQIEVELLDEPEKWSQMEKAIIDPLIKELGGYLTSTTESKLDKGLKLLKLQSH